MDHTGLLYQVLSLFAASLVVGLIATPVIRTVASRLGLVDHPDGRRKIQSRPIPVAGGVAVYLSTAVVLGVALWLAPDWRREFFRGWSTFVALFFAGFILVIVGVIDDWRGMSSLSKVLGQLFAAGIVISGGVLVESVTVFDYRINMTFLAIPFTLFWLLGAINSLNLIDGMDGLLGSVGLILCLTIGGMAMMNQSHGVAFVAVALAGALVAFLWFNFPPASIYLGDAGSMWIGLAIGTLAIQASLKGPATVALAAPMALLAIPIFDTSAAIVRRKLTGRSIFTTDRGHLHHILLSRGLSNQRVLLLVIFLCILAGAGALITSYRKNEIYAIIGFVAVLVTLLVSRLFGVAEFLLVKARLSAMVDSVRFGHQQGRVHQIKVPLQGSANWDELWRDLTDTAEALRLKTMTLTVNAPAIHEAYHARWERRHTDQAENTGFWRLDVPLTLAGQGVGQFEVIGLADEESAWRRLADLAKVVEGIESAIALMAVAKEQTRRVPVRPPAVPGEGVKIDALSS